jgi:DNA-binding protein HU-beta
MNLSELKLAVSKESGLTKSDAEKAVKAVFNVISNTLTDGNFINIIGFGSFSVRDRAAFIGRNPRTGTAIKIPKAKVAKFRVATRLKNAVNQK